MNIEINRETEQGIRKEIQSGHFHNLDELLTRALDALEKEEISASRQSGNPLRLVDALMSPPVSVAPGHDSNYVLQDPF